MMLRAEERVVPHGLRLLGLREDLIVQLRHRPLAMVRIVVVDRENRITHRLGGAGSRHRSLHFFAARSHNYELRNAL